MAVRGSTAKGVGKKIKPKAKKIEPFRQYESREQSDAFSQRRTRSGARQTAPKISGIKGILQNYRVAAVRPSGGNPVPTRRISPNRITRLKQQRLNEASESRLNAYRNAPNVPPKSRQSQAAKMNAQTRNRPTSFSVRQKAPSKAPGRYQKAVAAPVGVDDYRRDFRSFAANERRNKMTSDSRERARIKSARRKRNG